jgi:hypothetical protein
MRCKLCDLPHKNITRHQSWIEHQICRSCSYVLDVFSWNSNYLKEYWGVGHAQ